MKRSVLWLALFGLGLLGCGRGLDPGACNSACVPACPTGTVCSSSPMVSNFPFPRWRNTCLQVCAHATDCPAGTSCRNFESSLVWVCAANTLPALCSPTEARINACDANLSYCLDAHTLARGFIADDKSDDNGTCGHELVDCAKGCVAQGSENAGCLP
jgi:hypothetical protein